ncbi:MAG: ribonuclease E/G, partial [Mycobacteriaceae bacterium]
SEEKIAEDVDRLHRRWLDITGREEAQRDKKGSTPVVMYEEPNLLVKVVRDLFNEDFNELVVDGGKSWGMVHDYVHRMAPDLEDKLVKWNRDDHDGEDAFAAYELDDQLSNAKSRKVWLPSGGYLVIDRTEAMIVIDVNTGSFTGSGGNLEETVTKNNLEAAEEIVRQMRLRDMGGMIVVDFIDMVLEENRDLVLRRLTEFLASDRTRHKISEVTSLGLVQMTRKRLGAGLVETYSTECEACAGRGIIVHEDPVEHDEHDEDDDKSHKSGKGHRGRRGYQGQQDGADRDGLKQARHEQEIRRRYEQHAEPPTAEVAKVVHSAVQDTAESTESTEPAQSGEPAHSGSAATGASTVSGGGRRVRRRIVRRAADEEQDASRDAGDAGDDISSIAAHAVAHAGDVDPEEPTGADYVADEPDSAAAVETPDSGDEDTDAGADTDTGVTVRRSRDRRGRRVVRRVVETPEADRAPEAAAATGTDTPTDTGQESTPDPRAEFENARADFQRSPRRRRRVRGNSRSDVAPAPGDFGLQASQVPEEDPSPVQQSEQAVTAEPAGTPAPSTEQSSGAGDDQKSRHQENRRPRSGRRRRRKVVRSSS